MSLAGQVLLYLAAFQVQSNRPVFLLLCGAGAAFAIAEMIQQRRDRLAKMARANS